VIPLLLDTCVVIWFLDGQLPSAARTALANAAAKGNDVFVSPICAWELGLLVSRGRLRLSMTPVDWFERLLAAPGIALAELSPRLLVHSSFLPGTPPRDPADRIIAATARANGYCIMTRDRQLLDYAAEGHVKALAC
jgi:PIN domain nuclease of toxin-antitoxin system